MSDDVIVIMADEKYIPHAMSLMVNCRRQGNWKGDFCFLAMNCDPPDDFESRGISVYRVPETTMQAKFYIFAEYFQQWKRLLYIDCDSLVQGDLNIAFEGLSKKLPAIVCDGGQQPEEGSVLKGWEYFDDNFGKGWKPDAHPELYEKLRARFTCLDKLTFCADIMFFSPETIPVGTVAALQTIQEEFAELNCGGHDQAMIVSLFYDRIVPMTKDYCCWFPFDEPSHRVAQRGWRGDEEPVILHYFSWFAPWIVKQDLDPPMGAYFNYRLDRVCHELYAENLAAFDKEFPIT